MSMVYTVLEQTKTSIQNLKVIVDLGSCVLHVLHNGFGKGLEMYDKDIDQLCMDLHAIFKYSTSAARRDDYQQL